MFGLLEIGVAILGGAIGNKAGKSSITGKKPLNKILAPLAAVAVGYGTTLLTGGEISPVEALEKGGVIGVSAVGVYSTAKNFWQLLKN